MVLENAHEQRILEAVRKAALSVDFGEVLIKIDKTAPILDVVITTQEKLRFEKTA